MSPVWIGCHYDNDIYLVFLHGEMDIYLTFVFLVDVQVVVPGTSSDMILFGLFYFPSMLIASKTFPFICKCITCSLLIYGFT
jgi:hypothetical protein